MGGILRETGRGTVDGDFLLAVETKAEEGAVGGLAPDVFLPLALMADFDGGARVAVEGDPSEGVAVRTRGSLRFSTHPR